MVEPIEFPSRVMTPVEGREPVDATLELRWQGEDARLLERPGARRQILCPKQMNILKHFI